jgi:2Fe-2S ferredoxin
MKTAMPTIHVIRADGSARVIPAADGSSVMQAITGAGEAGIVAECGGSAMCATCHVYVDDAWVDRLPAPLSNELEMLECTAAERGPTSRLSCQIRMSAELDGLSVRLPERQQ